MRGTRVRAAIGLLSALGLACATSRGEGPRDWPLPVEAADDAECFEREVVDRYLTTLHGKVFARWRLPGRVAADRFVRLGFILDEGGEVLRSAVFASSSAQLTRSAQAAFEAACPFEPVPYEALCLVRRTLYLTFRNPREDVDDGEDAP